MKKQIFVILSLAIILVLVSLPRFNMNDFGPVKKITGKGEYTYTTPAGKKYINLSPDQYVYLEMTDYFRGYDVLDKITAPFSYRPLAPMLASILPFNAMTSINIMNLIFVLIGALYIYYTAAAIGFGSRLQYIGALMFIVSFPVFYYAPTARIDAIFVTLLAMGLYYIIKRNKIALLVLFFAGPLAKEMFIIIYPVLLIFLFSEKPYDRRFLLWSFVYLLVFIMGYIISRSIIPVDKSFFWKFSTEFIDINIYRPRTYMTFILSAGFPVFFTLLGLTDMRNSGKLKEYFPYLAGIIMGVLWYISSIFMAYTDGRFMWATYPFAIPTALFYLKRFRLFNERVIS